MGKNKLHFKKLFLYTNIKRKEATEERRFHRQISLFIAAMAEETTLWLKWTF